MNSVIEIYKKTEIGEINWIKISDPTDKIIANNISQLESSGKIRIIDEHKESTSGNRNINAIQFERIK